MGCAEVLSGMAEKKHLVNLGKGSAGAHLYDSCNSSTGLKLFKIKIWKEKHT